MPKGQAQSPTAKMEAIIRGEIYKHLRLYREITGKPFNMGAVQGAKRGPKPKGQKAAKGNQYLLSFIRRQPFCSLSALLRRSTHIARE